ncbi:unnamed protein product [Owenia fusiformis]|uniref:Uncharacterized protein n=1 Tax=Owenia fusiformis TaxID=6347 RepID=A0A8S4N3Q6_OWEFU|nr:unnamed protein product [Owenia fusiformis]
MPRVDLDEVLKEFEKWHTFLSRLTHENEVKTDTVKSLTNDVDRHKLNERRLTFELSNQRKSIESLHGILKKRCDYEDETRLMKEKIELLRQEHAREERLHREELASLKDKLDDAIVAGKAELDEEVTKAIQNGKKEMDQLQAALHNKDVEIEHLQMQKHEIEKDKQTELMKLRLEYDSKLLKIQKQNVSKSAPSASANQDIFRKKLQHIKTETEREVAGLKRTITDLEQKLQKASLQTSQMGQSGPLSKRRRFP